MSGLNNAQIMTSIVPKNQGYLLKIHLEIVSFNEIYIPGKFAILESQKSNRISSKWHMSPP